MSAFTSATNGDGSGAPRNASRETIGACNLQATTLSSAKVHNRTAARRTQPHDRKTSRLHSTLESLLLDSLLDGDGARFPGTNPGIRDAKGLYRAQPTRKSANGTAVRGGIHFDTRNSQKWPLLLAHWPTMLIILKNWYPSTKVPSLIS